MPGGVGGGQPPIPMQGKALPGSKVRALGSADVRECYRPPCSAPPATETRGDARPNAISYCGILSSTPFTYQLIPRISESGNSLPSLTASVPSCL